MDISDLHRLDTSLCMLVVSVPHHPKVTGPLTKLANLDPHPTIQPSLYGQQKTDLPPNLCLSGGESEIAVHSPCSLVYNLSFLFKFMLLWGVRCFYGHSSI